jgi:hypothetical protein
VPGDLWWDGERVSEPRAGSGCLPALLVAVGAVVSVAVVWFGALAYWTGHYERRAAASGMAIEDPTLVNRAVSWTVPAVLVVELAVVLLVVALRVHRRATGTQADTHPRGRGRGRSV